MDFGITGKTALVTASSKGLGKATAIALAAEGANVIISARNEDTLMLTAAEIKNAGGNVHAVAADITDPTSPRMLVDTAIEKFGGLDILVANAGGPPPLKALDVNDEAILAAINANMLTSIRLVQAATPLMQNNKWGRICLITSRTIKEPSPVNTLSNLARTGLWAWAKTASNELFQDNVTLNTICPGNHATDRMKELPGAKGPFGDPNDFGKAVAFLCSDVAKFINGTTLVVDGGSVLGL